MKRIFTLLAFALVCKSLFSQAYLIPWAEVQPAWVFPMWLENGDGQRDTIYFGYDTNAGYATDTLFGEKFLKVNPNVFSARFYHPLENDSNHLKVSILQEDVLGEGVSIFTQNPVLPIILTWDENAFYSDSIPFPDLDPAPRAEGHLWYDGPTVVDSCVVDLPILMTDTVQFPFSACHKTDSIVFEGPALSYLVFSIHPWNGIVMNNHAIQNEGIVCNVVLGSNTIKVILPTFIANVRICIADISGKLVYSHEMRNSQESVDISNLSSSVYLIHVSHDNQTIFRTKFLKP